MAIPPELVGADPTTVRVVNGMDNGVLGSTIYGELMGTNRDLDGDTVDAVLRWALDSPDTSHGEVYTAKQGLLKAALGERMLQSAGLRADLRRAG